MSHPASLVLTAAEVAVELKFFRRDGEPDKAKVVRYVRSGTLPTPIDPELPVVDWRWSRQKVERYTRGLAVAS